MYHSDLKGILKCPVCGSELNINSEGKSLYCKGARRHCFDLSSKGYVNFAVGHNGGGDSKEAVRSRSAFLGKGYYRPFANELCALISKYVKEGTVVDAGCGEGYYTNLVTELCGVDTVGIDLSKYGVEHAAAYSKRNGILRSFFAVAGIYDMPVRDGSVDCVMNLFAPCAEQEFDRVLKKGGVLIVAGAGEDHLLGLKKAIYDNPYKNETRSDLPTKMKHVESKKIRFEISLPEKEDRMDLFAMTPYFYRTSPNDAKKLENAEGLVTEAEFNIEVYEK